MDLNKYLEHINSGRPIVGNSKVHEFMHKAAQYLSMQAVNFKTREEFTSETEF